MRWRQVGPFRGGRVLAVTGVPGEPNVFYFGGASSGVWKSTDAGTNWQPLFDKQPIASIGAIAVAQSDHNVIYVGIGRGLHPRQHLLRQRRVQVGGCGQDVEKRRPERYAATSAR